jgi:hypothetical protein
LSVATRMIRASGWLVGWGREGRAREGERKVRARDYMGSKEGGRGSEFSC